MSKLERLLKLLAALLDTPVPLTAEDLRRRIGGYAEKDDAFRRAFERDKEDLRNMGVDIRVETVPGIDPPVDGYRVDTDDYAGRDPGLDPDELASLHLAAALVRFDAADDAFWKLGGTEGSTGTPDAIAVVPTSEDASTLHGAIGERRTAAFRYRDVDRILEPARLSFLRGHWYVSGFDRAREDERVFRLDRIVGPIELGDPDDFEPSPARGPELTRTWELGDGAPIVARVRIDTGESIWARVHLSESEIVSTDADGSVVVELNVRNVDAFRDWVLGFVDNAEVLEPVELRDSIVEWLRTLTGVS
ncbi:MAG: helix-turn-helix transcriptional regulator [Acidimicrobiales bacterium]